MLVLFAALLAVQEPDTVRISYTEALEIARESNPRFVRQKLQAENAESWMATSRAQRYYPTVGMNVVAPEYVSALTKIVTEDGEIYVPTERRTLQTGVVVNQPLPTGGSFQVTGSVMALNQPLLSLDERYTGRTFLGFRLQQNLFGVNNSIRNYRLARESFARSRAEFADQERALARSVLSAYYGLVSTRKQMEIDSMLFVRDSLRSVKGGDGNPQGPMSEVDSLKFELEAARSAFNRTRSNQALLRAQATLNEALGFPPGKVVIPDSALLVERLDLDVERGVQQAMRNRWDYALAQMGVENRRMGLRDAGRTSPVTVFVNTTIGFDGSARSVGPSDALRSALDGQNRSRNMDIGVSIPLFDRFEEKNAVARARNELQIAEYGLADARRALENEVRLAAQRVANASRQLELADKQFAITRRTMQLQGARYAQGEITIAEFLIDQASQRQAEIGMLQAKVELLTANEEWRRAIGESGEGETPAVRRRR